MFRVVWMCSNVFYPHLKPGLTVFVTVVLSVFLSFTFRNLYFAKLCCQYCDCDIHSYQDSCKLDNTITQELDDTLVDKQKEDIISPNLSMSDIDSILNSIQYWQHPLILSQSWHIFTNSWHFYRANFPILGCFFSWHFRPFAKRKCRISTFLDVCFYCHFLL